MKVIWFSCISDIKLQLTELYFILSIFIYYGTLVSTKKS